MTVSMNGCSAKRYIHRFSLVELLVVILIIGALLALGGAGYTIAQKKLAETRTRATLEKIKLALEAYNTKHGYYIQQYGDKARNADGTTVIDNDGNDYYYFRLDKTYLTGSPTQQEKDSAKNNISKIISYKDTPFDDPAGYKDNGMPKGNAFVLDSYSGAKNADNTSTFDGKRRWVIYICPASDAPFELRSAGHDRVFGRDNPQTGTLAEKEAAKKAAKDDIVVK